MLFVWTQIPYVKLVKSLMDYCLGLGKTLKRLGSFDSGLESLAFYMDTDPLCQTCQNTDGIIVRGLEKLSNGSDLLILGWNPYF